MAIWKRYNRKPAGSKAAKDPSDASPTRGGDEQKLRAAPRHPAAPGLRTSLGRALDISACGARLRCDTRPAFKAQSATPLEIFLATGSELVNARVCWVRRKGLYKPHWEVGMKFIAVPEAQGRRLSSIAERGFCLAEEEAPESDPAVDAARKAEDKTAMLSLQAHFEQLELDVDASVDDVRAAHRRLVRSCHPDVSHDEDAKATFLRLQKSYHEIIEAFKARDTRRSEAA